jgi:hypothetical protein
MKKALQKRMSLSRETLLRLETSHLGKAAGGVSTVCKTTSDPATCEWNSCPYTCSDKLC